MQYLSRRAGAAAAVWRSIKQFSTMATPVPDTPANSSSNNSTSGRSPRPDRDAFLRRLEERQRQRQIQQEDNDGGNGGPPGAETGGTPEVPGGGDGTAAAAGVGADSRGSDQKRPAPSTPAGAAAVAVAASTHTSTSARRRSGIPPMRASSSSSVSPSMQHAKERYEALRRGKDSVDLPSSAKAEGNGTNSPARKGPEEDGTEKKMATEADTSMSTPATVQSEAAAASTAASVTAASTSAVQEVSSVVDRNEARTVESMETDADGSTPLILSYLSECGISLTADLGIFVPADTATGPAGPQFTQRLEEAFDPASLRTLLDMSQKRKGDHTVLVGEDESGDGKENSLAGANTYLERVREQFADRPAVYDEFVALMLDLDNDKIDIHTVTRKVVTLFRGHDDLIVSFNEHLPEGCSIELTGTDLNNGERSDAAAAAAAASRDLLAEKSFEEERWEHYKRARSTTNAAVNESASEAGQQGGSGSGSSVGAGDDTSTVPPLREIRGGAPSASTSTVTGPNATTLSYSPRISDLTMPPSLATNGIGTGANSVSNGGGADTIRTDATVAGEVGGASAAVEEQEAEFDLSSLEPWQRALFRRIDEQTRLVRQIEGRVDALAETIRIQQQQQQQTFRHQHPAFGQQPPFQQPEAAATRLMEIPQNRDEAVQMLRNIPPPPGGNAPGLAQQDGAVQQQGQPLPNQPQQQQFFFLSILELLVEGLITILTAPYAVGLHITSVLSTLRPVRLLRHLYREADRRGVLRRFDLSLLFKFVFVSAILAGRAGGAGRRRGGNRAGGGAELLSLAELWDRHRLSILIGGTVLGLLYQTGFVNLVWDVIVKEDAIGMIWRDEDIRDEEGAGAVVEAADNAENNDNAAARGDVDAAADAADRNGARINQDANQANNAANGGGGNAGAAAARQPARRAPPPRPAPPQQPGFFGGGIEPVPANGGFSALGFVVDIVYIIGSLFLSLLPAWHPEPIRRPPPGEPQQRANADGDNGDGDANIDGGDDNDNDDAMNGDDNDDPVQGNE